MCSVSGLNAASAVYVIKLVATLAAIGYVAGIPWAIFYLVSQIILSMLAFAVPLVLLFAVTGYGVLFYFELPWWYVLLFGANVLTAWNYAAKDKSGIAADIFFWIGIFGMIRQCFFG